MTIEVTNVRIVEEVPGVEPHWFIADFPMNVHLLGCHPHFETHEKAARFCQTQGWAYTTEYFG